MGNGAESFAGAGASTGPGWLAGSGGRPEGYCPADDRRGALPLVDGIKWRAMPCGVPPWPRVYAVSVRWRDTGLVAELNDRLRGAVRHAVAVRRSRVRRSWTHSR
ncbi:hypothetical protein GCM10010254_24080 [Streptomyces chromofuscus]|nr:hypothetical protein GCM10010254_24080 [Streptomyces chromofuscus]